MDASSDFEGEESSQEEEEEEEEEKPVKKKGKSLKAKKEKVNEILCCTLAELRI